MFAVMRESDYYNNPIFRKNFWEDFKKVSNIGSFFIVDVFIIGQQH